MYEQSIFCHKLSYFLKGYDGLKCDFDYIDINNENNEDDDGDDNDDVFVDNVITFDVTEFRVCLKNKVMLHILLILKFVLKTKTPLYCHGQWKYHIY